MYPDWALGEFYPHWLIQRAKEAGCQTTDEFHDYCHPRMQAMAEPTMLVDKGPEWLDRNYEE